MAKMFDELGGLGKLVAGKTVAMKVNLTGGPHQRLGHLGAESAHWTHPAVIAASRIPDEQSGRAESSDTRVAVEHG
jgi:hypothetical protein